jgi:hypothetical protein
MMRRPGAVTAAFRFAIAALLAAAVAPAFARGQPELPDDDGGRTSVLCALDPAQAANCMQPHATGGAFAHARHAVRAGASAVRERDGAAR